MRLEAEQARRPEARAMAADGTPVIVDTFLFDTEREGDSRYIHHAASPEDLRAVLLALPHGVGGGLSRIVSALGKWEMNCAKNADEGEPDPLTGRLGWQLIPGVYGGTWLGMYQVKTATVWLHAYVYDPERLPLPSSLCELFLRLQTLTTFVHELAIRARRAKTVWSAWTVMPGKRSETG